MLDAAWRNLVVTGRAFQFKEIDAQSVPFENDTFEAVIANHMLFHVTDRPKALAEIKRVLKPGGHLFATTSGQNHLKEMANWIRQATPGADFAFFGNAFTLENGFEQLAQFFPRVRLSRYPDSLQVTDVKAILAFIRSTSHAAELSEAKLAELQSELERELETKGKISIQKDSGLFEATK
jgi:ubiquinone/menaquinone biosynthesis C-methylase UbiE